MASQQSETTETNYIFVISFITSSVVFLFGIFIIVLQSTTYVIIIGLIALLIGSIQLFADIGWVAIVKANRSDELQSWNQAIHLVIKLKSQKIFLFPIIFDLLLIGISSYLIIGI